MDNLLQIVQVDIDSFLQARQPLAFADSMQVIRFMIDFIQNVTGRMNRFFHDVWNIDHRSDTFRYISAREATRTDIDRVKNIQVYQGTRDFIPGEPRARLRQGVLQLENDRPRSMFDVQYIENFLHGNIFSDANVMQARNINQIFRYMFNRDYLSKMNLTIRQELRPYSSGLDNTRDNMVSKQSISVGNILQYAQVCDFDFTKACLIIAIMRDIMQQREYRRFCQLLDENVIFIAIKLTQYLNGRMIDVQRMNTGAIAGEQFQMLSQAEHNIFMTEFGRDHSFFFDNIVTTPRVVYFLRPQYGRMYDTPFTLNQEILVRGNLQQGQQQSIRSILNMYRGDDRIQMTGIYAGVVDILTQRIKFQIKQYQQIQNLQTANVTLFIGVTFQVPLGPLDIQLRNAQDQQLNDANNDNINKIAIDVQNGNVQHTLDDIQNMQIDDITGLSEYYTINMKIKKNVNAILNANFDQATSNQISQQLQIQVERLVSQYAMQDDANSRVAPLLACMQYAVIRKMTVRPYFQITQRSDNNLRNQVDRVDNVMRQPDRNLFEALDQQFALHMRQNADSSVLVDAFGGDLDIVSNIMYDQESISPEQIEQMSVNQRKFLSPESIARYDEYRLKQQIWANVSAETIYKILHDQDALSDAEIAALTEAQLDQLPYNIRWRQEMIREEINTALENDDNFYAYIYGPTIRKRARNADEHELEEEEENKKDNDDDDVDQYFNAIYSKEDNEMHRKYGYDEDLWINCVDAVNRRLQQLGVSRLIRNVDDIAELEADIDIQGNLQIIRYTQNGLLEAVDNSRKIILFVGYKHIFVGNIYKFIMSISKILPRPPNKTLYRLQNIEKQCMQSLLRDKIFISAARYYAQRCRANVYFDFETTFDDQARRFINTGFNSQSASSIRDQCDFAVSIVVDVKFNLERVYNGILEDEGMQAQQHPDLNYSTHKVLTFWHIPAAEKLMQVLEEIGNNIDNVIAKFNKLRSRLNTQHDIDVFNTIQCFSFNGSKFDNHFVLSQIKQMEGERWIEHVKIIGSQADMKSLSYKQYVFLDLRLMTGATSLKQFCIDMQINDADSKKDIDMNKMRTLTLCEQNKDEIMMYVANDSISIAKIHKKFMKSIRHIIAEYADNRLLKIKPHPLNPIIPDSLETKLGADVSRMTRLNRSLKGQFSKWMTISGISKQIYTDYFCQCTIRSPTDDNVMDMMTKSYQGGYTQAFWIGEKHKDDQIIYLDFNSMYPAIMSKLLIPYDLRQATVHEMHDVQINSFNANRDFNLYIDIDPFTVDRGCYNMHACNNNFALYELSAFVFDDQTIAPSFGLRSKISGTIYPSTYDIKRDSEICEMPVIFGFQLIQAFRNCNLRSATIRRHMQFPIRSKLYSVFKSFDEYMYHARQLYKEQKNASMAQCIKLFINSLYGKFGEKHHDIEFRMNVRDFANDVKFQDSVDKHMRQHPNIRSDYKQHLNDIDISNTPLFDLNDRDVNLVNVKISNAPFINNHIGSFVYFASMITAVGRTQITDIINQINTADARVYYADTDSLIMNKQAAVQAQKYVTIDDKILGAMKNEYPADSHDRLSTSIQNLVIINKKIYQYRINDMWINKFKGCRDARNDMYESFKSGRGKYTQMQTRFKKRNGNVTIIDMDMEYKLRLSRCVNEVGLCVRTQPFKSIYAQWSIYKDANTQIVFSEQQNQWVIRKEE